MQAPQDYNNLSDISSFRRRHGWKGFSRGGLTTEARPLRPILRIDELAAELLPETSSVIALSEAEHVEVRAIAIEGMAAVAQRQAFAEKADGHVVAAGAAVCGKGDLVGPVAVDRRFAELASAIDHATTKVLVAARAHATRRTRGGGKRLRSMRAAGEHLARLEQTGNIAFKLPVDNFLQQIDCIG